MNAKKWCILMLCISLFIGMGYATFNIIVDPFGAFGSDWYSYNETSNPRVAKISYLKKHHDEYDSYIIGCSSTSSYPVETLNKYTGGKFYNMIFYGSDMLDSEQIVYYLVNRYEVKNIVLNIYLSNGTEYDFEDDPYTGSMHPDVDGSSKLRFYSRFAFADYMYSVQKLKANMNDRYLPEPYDVFNEKTGAYDKRKRDAEPISNLEDYLAAYPEFVHYNAAISHLTVFEQNGESLKRIKNFCDANGVNLYVINTPAYYEYYQNVPPDEMRKFYKTIAESVDFWDFSISSVSYDPRYFYDATHIRNDVGRMAIERMFGEESLYIPEDFGTFVTKENVDEYVDSVLAYTPPAADHTTSLPILLYHHLDEKAVNGLTVTPDVFDAQMKALKDAGCHTVTLQDILDYIDKGISLPEKPVLITFDDGYFSNYEYAYPILKKYGMHATIFAVGATFGTDTYKDTGEKIFPHFGATEMAEMEASGVIDVQSHTYDMHQSEQYETGTVYDNVLIKDGESETDYAERFRNDLEQWEKKLNKKMTALAFPHGDWDIFSQHLLNDYGVRLTFSTVPKKQVLIKGLKASGLAMGRFSVTNDTTPEEILNWIQ